METLNEELKNYLNITWEDEHTENKINGIIERGKFYLKDKTGSELDFEENMNARQLLLDYGRYVYNHSLELFEINFKRELLSLILKEGVKKRADTAQDAESSS